jgi:hypothetical protein
MAVMYSWFTGLPAPYQMWITFGMFGHVLTVASPVLYYVLNPSARQIVWQWLRERTCERDSLSLSVSSNATTCNSNSSNHGNNNNNSLLQVLQDERQHQEFLRYAQQQCCEENIYFWQDVQNWKRCTDSDRKQLVSLMWNTYFSHKAALPLNLRCDLNVHLAERLVQEDCAIDLFDVAEAECVKLLDEDSFRNFLLAHPRHLRVPSNLHLAYGNVLPFEVEIVDGVDGPSPPSSVRCLDAATSPISPTEEKLLAADLLVGDGEEDQLEVL